MTSVLLCNSLFLLRRKIMFPQNPNAGPMPGPMGPSPVTPVTKPGVEGSPSPDEMKRQLVGLLKQAKQMADANGLDWNEISSEVNSKAVSSSVSVPHPPSPEFKASAAPGKVGSMGMPPGGMPGMMG